MKEGILDLHVQLFIYPRVIMPSLAAIFWYMCLSKAERNVLHQFGVPYRSYRKQNINPNKCLQVIP